MSTVRLSVCAVFAAPLASRPHAPPPRVGAPSSATLLKRRQLRSFGWRLVSIPYFEWDQLHAAKGSTAELQRRYLAAALDEAVAETVVAGVS